MKYTIKGMQIEELEKLIIDNGFSKFRASQIYNWLYKNCVDKIDMMENLSVDLKLFLKENSIINTLELSKKVEFNNTTKFLFRTKDNQFIETVSMIENNKHTICLSSQVGCSVDCDFCATGKMGFKSSLSTGEILDQLIYIKKNISQPITNIVFMGMGEPLMNYNNLISSIEKISSDKGLNISQKRIVVSTSGIPKMIKKLADENLKVNLALSLHSAIEEKRNKIMPFSKKFSLDDIKESLLYWYSLTKRRITFEYIVWKGVNDNIDDINALIKYCKSVPSKVNLIEYNSIGDESFKSASQNMINLYKDLLEKNKITVTVRRSRGKDIDAACGQLANK